MVALLRAFWLLKGGCFCVCVVKFVHCLYGFLLGLLTCVAAPSVVKKEKKTQRKLNFDS